MYTVYTGREVLFLMIGLVAGLIIQGANDAWWFHKTRDAWKEAVRGWQDAYNAAKSSAERYEKLALDIANSIDEEGKVKSIKTEKNIR